MQACQGSKSREPVDVLVPISKCTMEHEALISSVYLSIDRPQPDICFHFLVPPVQARPFLDLLRVRQIVVVIFAVIVCLCKFHHMLVACEYFSTSQYILGGSLPGEDVQDGVSGILAV